MTQPDTIKILLSLYQEQSVDSASALSGEELIARAKVPWERIRAAIPELEQARYIVVRQRPLGTRIFYTFYITREGIEHIKSKPAAPPAQAFAPLTLRIVPQAAGAQITWEADVLGRRVSAFQSPYDTAQLPLVIKALDAIQWPAHPQQGPKFDQREQQQLAALGLWEADRVAIGTHRRVGRALYDALVADSAGKVALWTARDSATEKGLPVSYLLRFPPEAIELAALPWETLWDDNGSLLLSRGRQAACVRYLDLDQALPPALALGSALRILAISPQAGIPDSVRAEERAARASAWGKLEQEGVVTLEELSPATLPALTDRIQTGPAVDIVHFYGHGHYVNGQGALLFDTPTGGKRWVEADRLAALLGETRLIVLCACQSAMIGEAGLLSGVAPALVAAGVPAVVAMQVTVRVTAATRFAEVLYRTLARGESVQHAVGKARQTLYVESEDGASWYVPTLTIRSRDTGPLRLVAASALGPK